MICCETCKFIDKVLLDSICQNELGDPKELMPCEEQKAAGVHSINLIYGTPPAWSLGTMVSMRAKAVETSKMSRP